MNFSMAGKFALQNLKANRLLEIPFVVSSGIMLILFNIMAGLLNNEYVQTRHTSLPILITLGVFLVGVFSFIFVTYTTNFLLKRRNKEFALYGILGLEKKHIRKIISIEFFILFSIITFIAVCGGYLFGQLTFLGLNRLMNDVTGRLMDYPFSFGAMIITVILTVALYLFTLLRSGFRIYLSTPVELLGKQHSGEGEPKSRFMVMIFGLISLGIGYYIALTTTGILSSLLYFFLAALLVMIATYLLFVSLSIIVLKIQKKRKSYYKPTKFLGVSGLLYRMKSNAISLASISILSVGVIITLSATATIYSSIQEAAQNVIPREYMMESTIPVNENNYLEVSDELKTIVNSTVKDPSQITNSFSSFNSYTVTLRVKDEFKEYTRETSGTPNYVLLYDLDGYNARMNTNIALKDDEILLCANQSSMADMNELTIGDRTFKVSIIDNIVPTNYAIEVYAIVVNKLETMQYIANTLKLFDTATNEYNPATINGTINWDVNGVVENEYINILQNPEVTKDYGISFHSEYLSEVYELNGGFLFLGIVVGIIFLTGTILITYYKQISEGYEDREKFQIMKKVGLEDKLINKTSSSQIIWMFYAPLIVAIIHCLIGSKIVYQLLGLFAVKNFMQYGKMFFIVIAIFFIIYFIIFKLTSRVYYKIVR